MCFLFYLVLFIYRLKLISKIRTHKQHLLIKAWIWLSVFFFWVFVVKCVFLLCVLRMCVDVFVLLGVCCIVRGV